MAGLAPLRFENVGDMAAAVKEEFPAPTLSNTVFEASDGLAPAGGPSVTMGAWGAKPFNAEGYTHPHSEWMAVTEGSVTVAAGGKEKLYTKGDIFLIPKGTTYDWTMTEDFKKFFVIVDHAEPEAAPTEVISYDKAQPCAGDEEYWFFCTGPEDLAPGSAVPTAASHGYMTSSCGQFSAGLWTCTAHETVMGEYPVHEFIFLLEGSIILTVDGEEHVFEAGDAFFIPRE